MALANSYWLTLLSIIVATMASFVGFDLAAKVRRSPHDFHRWGWIAAGALSIGFGVWSMNFIGMLALPLPFVISYDFGITLGSLALAIVGAGAVLTLVSRGPFGLAKLLGGGTLIGIAIVSMHYASVAAMRIEPPIRYNYCLVAISIAIAIGASTLALWNCYRLRSESVLSASWRKVSSAVIQGGAIYGMLYTAMAAASFASDSRSAVYPAQQFDPTVLALTVGAGAVVILLTLLLISASEELRASHLQVRVEKLGSDVECASVRVRDLSARLLELQDTERRRLASELHDIVGQNLSAAVAELAVVRDRLPAGDPELARTVANATLLAKRSVESIRTVMAQLRPPGLDELGLAAALRWHADALQSRTGMAVRVDVDESLPRAAPVVEDALLRIYLEALANVAQHASAGSVRITLAPRDTRIHLSIVDDGRGFDPSSLASGATGHWGIVIMQERAESVGGDLRLQSAPGKGTVVELSVPVSKWS
jgi:signal transduction histidine kinase